MVMDKELNEVLEKKFLCPSKFAQDIEKIVQENKDLNYIEGKFHKECNPPANRISPPTNNNRSIEEESISQTGL